MGKQSLCGLNGLVTWPLGDIDVMRIAFECHFGVIYLSLRCDADADWTILFGLAAAWFMRSRPIPWP